jgi:hypothetical protein
VYGRHCKLYNYDSLRYRDSSLLILKLSWAYNFNENPVGEVDIIENINMPTQNIVSLHTCGQCTFTNIGGTEGRSNCNNGGTISQACEDGTNLLVA